MECSCHSRICKFWLFFVLFRQERAGDVRYTAVINKRKENNMNKLRKAIADLWEEDVAFFTKMAEINYSLNLH